jgi:hypothetical protein
MPPRTKKAETPPGDLAGKTPANGTDLDAMRAEVAAEPDAAADIMVVPIGATSVRVLHYLDWPTSADEYFIAGRLTIWASKILHGDDYAKVWEPLDPTNRQTAEFIQALEKITGIPFVGSAGSPTT